MYHLLTGRPPFEAASSAEITAKHLTEQAADPRELRPELSEGVVHVVARAMAKRCEDRYADMGEMLADMELVRSGGPPGSAPVESERSAVLMRRLRAPRARTPARLHARAVRTPARSPVAAPEAAAPEPAAPEARPPQPPAPAEVRAASFHLALAGGVLVIAGLAALAGLLLVGDGKPPRAATGSAKQTSATPAEPPPKPPQEAAVGEAAKAKADAGIQEAKAVSAPRLKLSEPPAPAPPDEKLKATEPTTTPETQARLTADLEANLPARGPRQRLASYLGELRPGERAGWARLAANLDGKAASRVQQLTFFGGEGKPATGAPAGHRPSARYLTCVRMRSISSGVGSWSNSSNAFNCLLFAMKST